MPKDSRRVRYLRRVKRENTLMARLLQTQQHHLNVFAYMAQKMHQEDVYQQELGNSPEEA